MAVNHQQNSHAGPGSGRRMLVGVNVALVIVVVIALVGVIQAIAANKNIRWNMTSSAVNSLSDGTENLLKSLNTNVRLTSLYFKTDLEDEDQKRYRQTVDDLLTLYESSNRSKVRAEWVNPLSDPEKTKELMNRLRNKSAYKTDIDAYKAHVDKFKEIAPQIAAVLQAETAQMRELSGGAMGDNPARKVLAPIENLVSFLTDDVSATREQIDSLAAAEIPQYSGATGELKKTYRTLTERLKKLADYGNSEAQRGGDLTPQVTAYLKGLGSRSASLVSTLEEESKLLDALEPLKLDNVIREIRPNGNTILVETDAEAMIVDFDNVFPPIDQNAGGRIGFDRRSFKGEEQLTSAILRITHKEQTAVVYVRYGGAPLFYGGMPGERGGAQFAAMKKQLEDANFIVEEWDLKASTTMPEIKPTPTRTIFVVLKPNPPEQRNPMMGQQQPPDPPFGEKHRQALMQAMGDKPRMLFIAGWEPTPGMNPMQPMPIPASYEFNDYLKTNWGVSVDTSALLVEFASMAPGKYMPARRDFYNLTDAETTAQDIVKGPQSRLLALPWCAPLAIAQMPPEGVKIDKLITQPKKDGVWGIKNIQKYQEQQGTQEYLTKVEGDLEGPFDLAVAGTKGDAKMVLVSSRDFSDDSIAFARQMAITAQGLTLKNANPGNVSLLINSLHWLNDNTQFLNIGKPIDAAVLAVDPKAIKTVKVATIVLWPALALFCGGVAWWMRRR